MLAAVWKHLAEKEKEEEKEGPKAGKENGPKDKKKNNLLYPGRAPWEVHNSHQYI